MLVGMVGIIPLAVVSLLIIRVLYQNDLNFARREESGLQLERQLEPLAYQLTRYLAASPKDSGTSQAIAKELSQGLAELKKTLMTPLFGAPNLIRAHWPSVTARLPNLRLYSAIGTSFRPSPSPSMSTI